MNDSQTQKEALSTDERASHSPGPWTLDWNIAGGGPHPEFPELHYVCVRSREADSVTRELSITGYVRPADARLIRAAPDLYEICKEMLDWVHGKRAGRAVTNAITGRLVAVIDKVEGRGHD